jgi:hypothetical protein
MDHGCLKIIADGQKFIHGARTLSVKLEVVG